MAIPSVDPDERLLLTKLAQPGFYRAIARYGYMDTVAHGENFINTLISKVAHMTVIRLSSHTALSTQVVTFSPDLLP